MNYNPRLMNSDGVFHFTDNNEGTLQSRKMKRLFNRYQSYFSNLDSLTLLENVNYSQLTELIEQVNKKLTDCTLEIDESIMDFIDINKYAIEEQKIVGVTIKDYDARWKPELKDFKYILDSEISRPLKVQQVQASFYLTKMKRAANFSVPGAGKTAMMYGTFAYLSAPNVDLVDKILVISPLNAFESWRSEFIEVFGSKRLLNFMNLKKYHDAGDIRTAWGAANVIVLNYESLASWKLSVLNELINKKTMIVFDEVHRIKNPDGKRAKNALSLGEKARYRYVLTGTPIPNSYKDIYNLLHLLYDNEYNAFFGWQISDLDKPNPKEINGKLQPFFWRTNKQDLNVPPADEDKLIRVTPTFEQIELANTIHKLETNVLSRYIRLLQASTNPELLTEKINLRDLGFLFDEIDFNVEAAMNAKEYEDIKKKEYFNLNVAKMRTPKFEKGINLIKSLVSEGKKVIVWGMFVGTMKKIYKELKSLEISSHLIYGGTPKEKRVELIDDFRSGNSQVLISNPATLGESISLHQTVHDAIYFEYNFNLTFMLQSRDRIHRLGLPKNQYTRYYYLITEGDSAHGGFIDGRVYKRLKEKEEVMMKAIDGSLLVPIIEDDYLEDVKKIVDEQ